MSNKYYILKFDVNLKSPLKVFLRMHWKEEQSLLFWNEIMLYLASKSKPLLALSKIYCFKAIYNQFF
jgi:hypothetical protein